MYIKKLLTQHFSQHPTSDQLAAFNELDKFLSTFNEANCFVLRGYAGTGKTTIIGAVVSILPQLNKRTVLLAPTGRAAKVMSHYSGRKAYTVHKKIYRKKSASSLELDFTLAENLHENTLFIIDEASMISDESAHVFSNSVLDDLIRYVRSGKNCCLMFVGDTAQLPPVGMLESPALDAAYLASKYYLTVFYYELRTVVRQKNASGILVNATKIRDDIPQLQDDSALPFPQFKVKGYKDIFRMTGDRLIEGLHYSYDKFGLENSIVICRSNRSANLYNKHIRNQILFRDEEITGGDMIMVVKNNYYWLQQHDEKNTGFIANGDLAKVRKVSNQHEEHGFRFADIALEFVDDDELDPINCRVLLDSIYEDGPNLSYENQKKLYNSIAADYADIPTKKDRLEAIKKDPYYNALQIKFAYAITCHKAQGGQWLSVFVDQGYLNDEMLNSDFLRWLYTALTRATKQLFLVNFNPKFYND
ncbi:AAA family ATPase [Sphingobacterium sp. UT-1RO-CII-1]|uniref:ATP-dependent DNA helicase n=1 Tax=Sphingobacterium sp. UT-1RO-CII-1 TaxID=2995225 RepID=UPI00227B8872|nr:AAA family ATPase [Sphingobacterium sp. UT-1RO-CII-1]MCY4778994.1 AAA family ATPase [Sphingobacterium sp. UT-1RO-CII-1]